MFRPLAQAALGRVGVGLRPSASLPLPAASRYAAAANPSLAAPLGTNGGLAAAPNRRGFASAPPVEADIVIVGAGAVGASTFYHLTKTGKAGKVVLLEAHKATAGTTWHSAGLLWRLRPSDVEIELIDKTRELAITDGVLEQETGVSIWTANGGLFLANSEERLNEYRRLQTVGRYYGIESEVIPPEEVSKYHPLLYTGDLTGALYSPGDGLVDPSNITEAYIRGGTKRGGTVVEECRVTGVTKEDGLVTAVQTSKGEIRTKVVVNCCGVWAPQLGALAGVRVPLTAMAHAYVVTESMDNMGFVPNVRDHDLSVYLKYQGTALAIGGYEPAPIYWDDVDPEFSFGLFDLDWDAFAANFEGHMTRLPCLETKGVSHTVSGPESFTADHKPLIGPSPEVPNFWLGCGFNSAGIMLSGGCGEQLAHWILHGRPELDIFSYDISRFHPSVYASDKWVRDRSHESYAKNYAVVYPHDQPLAGRRTRPNPLYEKLVANGCVHMDTLGFERPSYFSDDKGQTAVKDYDFYGAYPDIPAHEEHAYRDHLKAEYSFSWPHSFNNIAREHLAARNSCAAFDMSAFGKYELRGGDSAQLVDALCTADVLGKGAWRSTYTHMLNHSGGVECDLTVSQLEDGHFYICTPGGSAQHDLQWFRQVARERGLSVDLREVTEERGVWSIQGRHARAILQPLTDVDLSEEAFPFASVHQGTVAGIPDVRLVRLTFAGELGFELHMPAAGAGSLYDAVHDAASKVQSSSSLPVLIDGGYGALESLSMEKGYRHWHADLRPDDTPIEAGMAFVCLEKLKAGKDFIGKAAVQRQRDQGVTKRLAFVYPETLDPIFGLEVLYHQDTPVGFLRRAGFAHSLGRPQGVAYVRHPEGGKVTADYLKGDDFSLDIMGKRVKCKVETKTPFDPKNLRIKGDYSGCEEIPMLTREQLDARM